MCLETVLETFKKAKDQEVHIGYKAVKVTYKRERKCFSSVYNNNTEFDKWLKAKQKKPVNPWTDSPPLEYPAGFHIFHRKKDAQQYCKDRDWKRLTVVRVQYRRVVAVGSQWDSKVIVAKEMFVEKPKAKKKVA